MPMAYKISFCSLLTGCRILIPFTVAICSFDSLNNSSSSDMYLYSLLSFIRWWIALIRIRDMKLTNSLFSILSSLCTRRRLRTSVFFSPLKLFLTISFVLYIQCFLGILNGIADQDHPSAGSEFFTDDIDRVLVSRNRRSPNDEVFFKLLFQFFCLQDPCWLPT